MTNRLLITGYETSSENGFHSQLRPRRYRTLLNKTRLVTSDFITLSYWNRKFVRQHWQLH